MRPSFLSFFFFLLSALFFAACQPASMTDIYKKQPAQGTSDQKENSIPTEQNTNDFKIFTDEIALLKSVPLKNSQPVSTTPDNDRAFSYTVKDRTHPYQWSPWIAHGENPQVIYLVEVIHIGREVNPQEFQAFINIDNTDTMVMKKIMKNGSIWFEYIYEMTTKEYTESCDPIPAIVTVKNPPADSRRISSPAPTEIPVQVLPLSSHPWLYLGYDDLIYGDFVTVHEIYNMRKRPLKILEIRGEPYNPKINFELKPSSSGDNVLECKEYLFLYIYCQELMQEQDIVIVTDSPEKPVFRKTIRCLPGPGS